VILIKNFECFLVGNGNLYEVTKLLLQNVDCIHIQHLKQSRLYLFNIHKYEKKLKPCIPEAFMICRVCI
jgi:hypothetical protein